MKNLTKIIGLSTVAGLAFLASCQKEKVKNITTAEEAVSAVQSGQKVTIGTSTVSYVSLIAGQTITCGTLSFDDVNTDNVTGDDALLITYTTTDGWELNEVHLWIGSSVTSTLNGLPMTRSGNPIPGQFPYTATNLSSTSACTTYTILVPFTTLGFTCPGPSSYYVAAHASVRKLVNSTYQSETAWGAGQRIATKGNWGMYFGINISCDEEEEEVETCDETAFAMASSGSTCFSGLTSLIGNHTGNGPDKRWGWSNEISSTGTYTMALWAGAGQCNTSNGTNVGVLTVVYNNGSAAVTYSVTSPYHLGAVHLYVGSAALPLDNQSEYTIAPGQFPIKADGLSSSTTTWSATVNNLSGTIYVVAHADVDGFACEL